MEAKPYYIYIARCRDDSLYTGIAVDPVRRLRQHVLGAPACARYTRSHPVCALEGLWYAENKSAALRMERAVKSLTHAKKQRLLQYPELWQEILPALAAEPVLPVSGEKRAEVAEGVWSHE